jgi:hypothetical protein
VAKYFTDMVPFSGVIIVFSVGCVAGILTFLLELCTNRCCKKGMASKKEKLFSKATKRTRFSQRKSILQKWRVVRLPVRILQTQKTKTKIN